MDKASEALADVRGWLCDNLSERDAGKVCGMLSVVSRHIGGLESENASLRGAAHGLGELCDKYKAENAKLRELIRTVWLAGDFRAFLGAEEIKERMRELGIEVLHD